MIPPAQNCSWCGEAVEPGEGYVVGWPDRELVARFCRLEHLVPWGIKGYTWTEGKSVAPDGVETSCARCGNELGPGAIYLVKHRGEHRIPDGFCSEAHLLEWAKAGGRWG